MGDPWTQCAVCHVTHFTVTSCSSLCLSVCVLVPFPACHPWVRSFQLCFPTLRVLLSLVEWAPHSIWGLGTWLDSSKHTFRCVTRQNQHPWRDRGAPGPLSGRVSASRNPLALGLLRPRRAAAVLCCLLAASWLGVTTVQMYLRKAGVGRGCGERASEMGRGKGPLQWEGIKD